MHRTDGATCTVDGALKTEVLTYGPFQASFVEERPGYFPPGEKVEQVIVDRSIPYPYLAEDYACCLRSNNT